MINVDRARRTLASRYARLTEVSKYIFRATDTYETQTYAVRYFDLQDVLATTARDLAKYQDALLGREYFSPEAPSDLQWNYYLYFVTSRATWGQASFANARATIESDQQYARKHVVAEDELESLLAVKRFADDLRPLPLDPFTIWIESLERNDLAFIMDDSLQVPKVVRKIESGEAAGLGALPATPQLAAAERDATSHFVASLEIENYRAHPSQRLFTFGDVNLIAGANGTGKTSLLEAIEFLFCGQNKRGGNVPAGTVISADIGSSRPLVARGRMAKDSLRARHLAWYGKPELRKVTLDDSFAKFNFLDTDAAVRLSVATSRDRIGGDLAQLLLGAEAIKTLDRFQRVLREISSAKKLTTGEGAAQELRSREARTRAAQLRQAPQQSDEWFQKLEASLVAVDWVNVPAGKDSVDGLGEALEDAVVNVRLLQRAGRALPRNDVELEGLLRETRQVIQRVTELGEERQQLVRDQARQGEQEKRLATQEDGLVALQALLASGVQEHSARLDELRGSVGSLVNMVADVEPAIATLSALEVDGGTVESALALCTQGVQASRQRAGRAERALKDYESKQTALRSLTQRLVQHARDVISHTGDATHCPLCGTTFEEWELLGRIDASLKEEGEREGTVVRSAADEANRELEMMTAELNALRVLRQAIPSAEGMGLAEAVARASGLRGQLDGAKAELESLEKKMAGLESREMTVGRLTELRSVAGLSDSQLSAASVEDALGSVRQERREAIGVAEGIASRLVSLGGRVRQEAEACVSAPVAEEDVASVLGERADRIAEAAGAVGKLRDVLRLPGPSQESMLEAQLVRASELVTELRSTLSQEKANAAMLEEASRIERDAVDSLAGLRVRLKRLNAAENIVEQLLAEHSEAELRQEVLRNNAAEISSTFAKLHAPNEFDLDVEDGQLHIARRSNGTEVELNEMSSGQRAAYALSLFLAMNESLRNGPKVILFDDPVAHIDDINTLSFLDYLREVALSGSRQLFFATADAQLAGLFKHKFRFLGDERFRVFTLVRAE